MRDNCVCIYFQLKNLKHFSVCSAGLSMGRAGDCGCPHQPLAGFMRQVCTACLLRGQRGIQQEASSLGEKSVRK